MHYGINNHDIVKLSWENIQMPFKTTLFSRACIKQQDSAIFFFTFSLQKGFMVTDDTHSVSPCVIIHCLFESLIQLNIFHVSLA